MTAAVAVTIGRNVSPAYTPTGQPMPLDRERWQAFGDSVRRIVDRAGYNVVADNEGIGEWEGAQEDNRVIVGIRAHRDRSADDYLRAHLARLATLYGQETIALLIGRSDLILADR